MPEPSDRTEHLARRLLHGVETLRARRFVEACEALLEVASAPDLAAAADLVDVRARATTLLAQAMLGAGDLDAALPWLDEAERLLGGLGDRDGLAEVRALRRQRDDALADRARKAQAAERLARLAETPLDALRARAPSPHALLELLVQKANAEVEAGRPDAAAAIAREGLDLALRLDSVRGEVLARLTLARAEPSSAAEQLEQAWRRAERADEFNLVGAVARAAELAGVALPTLHGPDTEPPA